MAANHSANLHGMVRGVGTNQAAGRTTVEGMRTVPHFNMSPNGMNTVTAGFLVGVLVPNQNNLSYYHGNLVPLMPNVNNNGALLGYAARNIIGDLVTGASVGLRPGGGISEEYLYNDPNRRCTLCNCTTFQTPMWRRGPHGPRTLCNACGIRYRREEERRMRREAGNNNNP
ncbi:hypothetical protein K2173_009836 [Erythroxylum novogranatense]|uniref:GATA-type domain-containing protein n=1 Tax=Erythroxylum novogranatense TaxID=1862640 RepID=A0AAV8T0F9_9ROSI|nr:hypothetical protein K2173_009836 [Erythroxylum novogranatense]